MIITWIGNNNGTDSKRGAGFVLMQFVGQCGLLLGTRVFPATEAPYYRKGFWVSFGFMVFEVACALTLRYYLKWQNKKKDDTYGPPMIDLEEQDRIGIEDDSNINFRYIL